MRCHVLKTGVGAQTSGACHPARRPMPRGRAPARLLLSRGEPHRLRPGRPEGRRLLPPRPGPPLLLPGCPTGNGSVTAADRGGTRRRIMNASLSARPESASVTDRHRPDRCDGCARRAGADTGRYPHRPAGAVGQHDAAARCTPRARGQRFSWRSRRAGAVAGQPVLLLLPLDGRLEQVSSRWGHASMFTALPQWCGLAT